MPYDKLVQVWGRIAEWTRREKPTGVIHREELRRRLIEALVDLEFDEDDPAATADSYLNAAVERAGLLEERGQAVFAFWHPTFEEFLAAVELAKTPERLLPLRDDPRWHEVILLAVGYVGVLQHNQASATELLDRIRRDSPSPLEVVVYSHLRLAAACIADNIGTKRASAEQTIQEFSAALWHHPYRHLSQALGHLVRGIPRYRSQGETLLALLLLVEHPEREVLLLLAKGR